jgi:hypothetical protein
MIPEHLESPAYGTEITGGQAWYPSQPRKKFLIRKTIPGGREILPEQPYPPVKIEGIESHFPTESAHDRRIEMI